MKKLIIITILLMSTIWLTAQDKMGFGNMPEGADSAGFGTVTTWKKPSQDTTDWTYEGVLTLAYINDEYFEQFGWSVSFDGNGEISLEYGSFSPQINVPVSPNGLSYFDNLISYDEGYEFNILEFVIGHQDLTSFLTRDDILVQIDGINYTLVWSDYYGRHVHEFPMPFRLFIENQTYNIKIKYTLAP